MAGVSGRLRAGHGPGGGQPPAERAQNLASGLAAAAAAPELPPAGALPCSLPCGGLLMDAGGEGGEQGVGGPSFRGEKGAPASVSSAGRRGAPSVLPAGSPRPPWEAGSQRAPPGPAPPDGTSPLRSRAGPDSPSSPAFLPRRVWEGVRAPRRGCGPPRLPRADFSLWTHRPLASGRSSEPPRGTSGRWEGAGPPRSPGRGRKKPPKPCQVSGWGRSEGLAGWGAPRPQVTRAQGDPEDAGPVPAREPKSRD